MKWRTRLYSLGTLVVFLLGPFGVLVRKPYYRFHKWYWRWVYKQKDAPEAYEVITRMIDDADRGLQWPDEYYKTEQKVAEWKRHQRLKKD